MDKARREHLAQGRPWHRVQQEALVGACEDHLPEQVPAEVEVVFCPNEYQQDDRAIPQCAHCLMARLE